MKITINDHRKIIAVQEEFNALFPNLILEFHAKPARQGGATPMELIKHHHTLGECRTLHTKGSITITPGMTVAELKAGFSDVYGLTTEVYRRSGNARVRAHSDSILGEINS